MGGGTGSGSGFESFLASDMAVRHADRFVARQLDKQDPVEKVDGLIKSAYSLAAFTALADRVNERSERPITLNHIEVMHPMFTLGIKVALAALLEAGMDPDQLPVEGLADRARRQSIGHSALLEASVLADGGDIRELYFEEEGGTARSVDG